MKPHFLPAVLTIIALIPAATATLATERLSLSVTPNVSNAPSNVIVRAHVAKDRDNRWLIVEADSGTFYRSSAIELDGDHAPVMTEFRLNNLPSGEYTVAAVLRNSAGEETTARRTVLVLGRFGEPR
jgi:hypothetical protein